VIEEFNKKKPWNLGLPGDEEPDSSFHQSENHTGSMQQDALPLVGGSRRRRRQRGKASPKPNLERLMTQAPALRHSPFPFLPDKFKVRLVYTNEETITNGASATVAQNFRINSVFDVDNAFGSTAMPAATALGTIYTRYTVLGGEVHMRVQNRETFANGIGYVFTNTNPGTSGSGLYIKAGDRSQSYKRGDFKLVSPVATGGSLVTFNHRFSVAQLCGSTRPYTDDNFSALVGADPTDLVWFSLFLDSGSASVQTNGAKFSVQIYLDVLYSQRASLST